MSDLLTNCPNTSGRLGRVFFLFPEPNLEKQLQFWSDLKQLNQCIAQIASI